jgi:metallo-beta-lactamase family protein
MADGLLPRLPLYVDSPLAADIAEVYARYPEAFHPSATPDAEAGLPRPVYLRTLDESEELAQRRGPSIIVASGGMCDGGRIVRHLRRHLDDPRATLALVSYQAPGSLGRRLLERGPTVRFHGRTWNKWIDVVEVNGFSGHADHDDLLDHLSPLAGRARVRLVHGEVAAAELLAADLRRRGFLDVAIPARDDMVTIT